ncbi:MAG TPA: alpha/beta hydrolase [Kofleriaceae bacterium]|nr:alpha/beta hydrolase [Kofleriaceae bacterium]
MTNLRFALVLALASCAHHDPAPPTAPAVHAALAGAWAGTIDLPGQPLAFSVVLGDDGKGTIDIPAQGATGLALSRVALAGDRVSFELAQVGAAFTGTLRGDAIAGTMTQSGQRFPFQLARKGAAPAADRYVPPPPGPALAASDAGDLVGGWRGAAGPTALALELAVRGDGVVGTAGLGAGCPHARHVAHLTRHGARIQFELDSKPPAYFDGELAAGAITGTLHRGGAASPARLTRVVPPAVPYRELEVAIASTGGVTLAGTLTLPAGAARAPAVVMVTGSGPQDRDECVYGVRPFRQLADYLARHGIASLRYDDRGTARSTGDFAAATPPDFADDARAALALLRTRAEIDPARIGILGHSEGGIIAPMVAAQTRDVAFIVLWAGPALPMPEVDVQQTGDMMRAEGAPEAAVASEVSRERRVMAALATAHSEAELRAALRAISDDPAWIDARVADTWSPWLRWYLDYDPAATLAKLRCPVLALDGSLDMQVAAAPNLAAIRKALAHHADVEVDELPGLNHLFQRARTGAVSEYAQHPAIDDAVLEVTTRWIAKHAGLGS